MTIVTEPDEELVERVVAFHGHYCPGTSIGIQAARLALAEVGPKAEDEEMVAVVETDLCPVDAIQALTGCTFGKGNLIVRNTGKMAFTFYGRPSGRAIRIVLRHEPWGDDPDHAEHMALMAAVNAGRASAEEQARFHELQRQRGRRILERDPAALFDVTDVAGDPPPRARLHDSVPCQACGETVMETRIRRLRGRDLCQPCFEQAAAAR